MIPSNLPCCRVGCPYLLGCKDRCCVMPVFIVVLNVDEIVSHFDDWEHPLTLFTEDGTFIRESKEFYQAGWNISFLCQYSLMIYKKMLSSFHPMGDLRFAKLLYLLSLSLPQLENEHFCLT